MGWVIRTTPRPLRAPNSLISANGLLGAGVTREQKWGLMRAFHKWGVGVTAADDGVLSLGNGLGLSSAVAAFSPLGAQDGAL